MDRVNFLTRLVCQSKALKGCFCARTNSSSSKYVVDSLGEREKREKLVDRRAGQEAEDIFADPTLTDVEKKKLKLIQQEYSIWKYADSLMPDHVTNEQWKVLLKIDTRSARIKYLTFLTNRKKADIRDEMRKERLKQEALERRRERESKDDGHLIYAIGHNTLFRRLELDSIVKNAYLPRLGYAMQHGPHLVYDTSFLNDMTILQQSLTAKQLRMVLDDVKIHRQPVHVVLSGVNRNSHWFSHLAKFNVDGLPVTVTEKNYTDIFPRNRLIYLSPTARDCLPHVDLDKIHIIGAIVDKGQGSSELKHATLGKAKYENIPAFKLPIDNYVKFQTGSKYLCLNHITKILLDVSVHKDWHKAFVDNIPQRKLTPYKEQRAIHGKRLRKSDEERMHFLHSMIDNVNRPE